MDLKDADPIKAAEFLSDLWWISFVSTEEEKFLGIIIGQGEVFQDVLQETHRLGINPGGQVAFVPVMKAAAEQFEEHKWRLIEEAELKERGWI